MNQSFQFTGICGRERASSCDFLFVFAARCRGTLAKTEHVPTLWDSGSVFILWPCETLFFSDAAFDVCEEFWDTSVAYKIVDTIGA